MRKTIFIIISIGILYQTQTVNLSKSHNPTEVNISYIIDYLQLDSILMSSVKIESSEIKKIKMEDTKIIMKTKMLVVLDGVYLLTKKEKKRLSTINKEMIDYVEIIKKNRATELYGRKAKNGALFIKTKQFDIVR